MRIINIPENSSFTLEKSYIEEFRVFLNDNSNLPLHLQDETIIFDSYIIGSINIKDLVINIEPRISKLTSNHYLEMQLYNEGLLDDRISSQLDENESYGVQENLIDLFLKNAYELVNSGLEGDFVKIREETNKIRGKILVEEISPINLLQDKIPIEYEIHTLNTSYNKIIKIALDKVRVLATKRIHIKLYSLVNSYFEDIEIDTINLNDLLQDIEMKTHFENENYSIVLGLAEKIIRNLKINLRSNKVNSSSYLMNSNSLFENYARKVLLNNLNENVIKWKKDKPMGKLKIGSEEYVKSYSPDIIINYHEDTDTAFAVLDAKNKDISNHSKIGDLSDIYQLLFYSNSLSSEYGGLVYPYYGALEPVQINVESFKETILFAFTIDFSKPVRERNKVFSNSVKNSLHIYD